MKINSVEGLDGFIRRNWSFVASVTAIFYLANLSLTVLAQILAPPFEKIPPTALMPENVLLDEACHAATGFLLGCLTLDPTLIAITTLFSVSIDIDHVFQLMRVSYLPRPAHSLFFLLVLAGSLWLRYRRRDLILVSTSAFLGHIALDSTTFPLFSPIYLHYFVAPDWMDAVLIAAAAVLNAGYTYHRRKARRSVTEAKTGLSESPHEG